MNQKLHELWEKVGKPAQELIGNDGRGLEALDKLLKMGRKPIERMPSLAELFSESLENYDGPRIPMDVKTKDGIFELGDDGKLYKNKE